MSKILLIRHGEVEGIKPERFRGREPLALTARGRSQAAGVASRIAAAWRPTHIYTSPLGRCIETGAAIAKACGVAAQVCDHLNDIDYGAWQFKTFAEAEADDAALFAAWFATPQFVRFSRGETLQDIAARTAEALRLVLSRHRDDTVVFVGHDSVNRVLLLQCFDLPLSHYWRLAQDPCCVNEIDIAGDGKICIQSVNETLHLQAIAA